MCSLQYFLSFRSFGREQKDDEALALRAGRWLKKLSTAAIWEEADM